MKNKSRRRKQIKLERGKTENKSGEKGTELKSKSKQKPDSIEEKISKSIQTDCKNSWRFA
ncbi:hypothetical protein [Methanosarcina siciliae]|uniref:hypothetical protein n=1 Tax=Methanosarcina siciliae TaxID=38027 RepID=UPI00064E737A|nr:hypothetical protein [Methanosarcina siciliae]